MKILHILGTDRLSGAENVHLDILRALKDENETIYCSPDGPIRRHVEEAGVRFLACDTENTKEIRRDYDEERPDVVHACDPRMSFKCARAGIPFISMLHCNCPWMKKYSPNSFALRYAAKRASAVIAVSQSIPDSYVFKKAFGDKLYVIPNAVDREKVERMAAEPYEGSFDVIFVGRLEPVKRPLLFLEVVEKLRRRLPDVTAAMVGDGELRDEVASYAAEHGLDNVSLLGFDSNPYRIMARSKVNVLTSEYEGFGLVAVEGMILSKPVAAFPAGGITEIAERGGIVCSDADQMARAVSELLTDPDRYAVYSKKAYEGSFGFTDTGDYISKIRDVYEKTLKSEHKK